MGQVYLEEQRKSKRKTKQSKKLLDLDEKLLSLNTKLKSLEEAIIEYQNEADKFAIEAEKKKNFEFLTISNSLKRAAKEKHQNLIIYLKKACTEEKISIT